MSQECLKIWKLFLSLGLTKDAHIIWIIFSSCSIFVQISRTCSNFQTVLNIDQIYIANRFFLQLPRRRRNTTLTLQRLVYIGIFASWIHWYSGISQFLLDISQNTILSIDIYFKNEQSSLVALVAVQKNSIIYSNALHYPALPRGSPRCRAGDKKLQMTVERKEGDTISQHHTVHTCKTTTMIA